MRTRLVLGAIGVLLGLFGVFRLVSQVPGSDLVVLAIWLVGALVIHDGILSPVVIGVGALIGRFVRPRARRYLQGALVSAAMITIVALPMIHRAHTQPPAKALLEQNFTGNLGVLLAIVGGGSILLYLLRVLRDRQAASATNARPPEIQDSASE